MSKGHRTPLEEELLLDLLVVQEQFQSSQIPVGTIRSKVMYRMASRRGKTRPAPVHGLSEADRTFKATFTRTVNRLLKKGLVQRRSVGLGDFHGLPYQWGYGRHGKRDRDVFLTEEGLAIATSLQAERSQETVPEQIVTKSNGPKPRSSQAATPRDQRPRHGRAMAAKLAGRVLYAYTPSPGIRYNVVLPAGVDGPRPVLYRHAVKMMGFDVIYEVVGTAQKKSPTEGGE